MQLDKKGLEAAVEYAVEQGNKRNIFVKDFGVQQIIEAYEGGKGQPYKWQYFVERTALYCQDNSGNDDQLQGVFVSEETALALCKILNESRKKDQRYEQE